MMDGRLHVYKRENSRLWQCSAFIDDRNWRASTRTDSLSEAKDFAEDWFLGLRGKSRAGILKTEKTFKQAAEVFEQEYGAITDGERNAQYVEGHWRRLKLHLLPFFGNTGLSEVKPAKVLEYRIKRRKELVKGKQTGPSRSTLHKEIVTLRQVLKTAVIHGWIDAIPNLTEPYKKAGKFGRRAWFNPEEYKQLYNATRERAKHPINPHRRKECEDLHDFVLFMVNTGLRPDEAYRLQFRDVKVVKDGDIGGTILHIDVRGKRGTGYCKSMPGAVIPFKRVYERRTPQTPLDGRERGPAPSDPVFPRSHHSLFKTILIEQGLRFDRDNQPRAFYSLRHTYISLRLMEGADIYQVAKNCRTSVEMIERHYAAHIKNMLDAAVINVRKPKARADKIIEASGWKRPEATPRSKGFKRVSKLPLENKGSVASVAEVRGRGEIGRRKGLKSLSALGETQDAELLKVGETGKRQSRAKRSGQSTGAKV
jgi:integrase